MNNSMMSLKVYLDQQTRLWSFDDERVNLLREPFVCGIGDIIDNLVKNINDAETGFRMTFSASRFPGCTLQLNKIEDKDGGSGTWYSVEGNKTKEGWLCPALFQYFEKAPTEIFVQAEAL